ncbi:MAG: HNH endonuclease signature motif containing protein [Candidatus Hydrogenedentota bacterium]
MTIGLAKNRICQALRELVDPTPSKKHIDELWLYFQERCAYCEAPLSREERRGHADHLLPSSKGGTSDLSNRVLSCPSCNGDEKLDQDWVLFLRAKCGDEDLFRLRKRRIDDWVETHAAKRRPIDEDLHRLIELKSSEICLLIDSAAAEVRNLRQEVRHRKNK